MEKTVQVKCLRPLKGDRVYARGDVRDLSQADAERLAETGAVEIVSATKQAAAPRNKMAAKPADKAVRAQRKPRAATPAA